MAIKIVAADRGIRKNNPPNEEHLTRVNSLLDFRRKQWKQSTIYNKASE